MINQFIARLAPCLVVIAVVALALGVARHDVSVVVPALVSVVSGVFAWIGAS